METYVDNTPLWDLSQASNFSQLADDDFLAILQKQFPITQDAGYVNGVNPQNITRLPLPTMTPPSEDSSPSPPNLNDSGGTEEQVDSAQKRKANEGDLDDESPSSKTQHTTNKKATTRRKSAGASGQPKDESRLLKRKEQNRAAQRAFRERKEKHVKDLEDKVAALEAKNEAAVAENENLRDLLSRLQQENLSLKQASFTFAVPKTGVTSENTQASTSFASQSPDFASSSSLSPATPVSSSTSTFTPKMTNPLDWSSLTSFDPNMLNLLDDTPQPTATDGAMQMDFGFGTRTALPSNGPFTTIASNPMFLSYAAAFDSPPTVSATQASDSNNPFSVDWSNLSSWQSPSVLQETPSLDDLLAGYLTHGGSNTAYVPSSSSVTSESPVTHHASAQVSSKPSPKSLSSSSSPSSSASDPLFDTPRDSSVSDSDVQEAIEKQNKAPCTGNGCPKTKGELADRISAAGSSPFAPMPLRKTSDAATGPMISCAGTKFPTTVKSDQNIEVLSAWRSITSNPRFKDVDINDLCAEFTSKAKCDGTKVVLEPQGVNSILQTLTGPKK